jgi:hypothetical protein
MISMDAYRPFVPGHHRGRGGPEFFNGCDTTSFGHFKCYDDAPNAAFGKAFQSIGQFNNVFHPEARLHIVNQNIGDQVGVGRL